MDTITVPLHRAITLLNDTPISEAHTREVLPNTAPSLDAIFDDILEPSRHSETETPALRDDYGDITEPNYWHPATTSPKADVFGWLATMVPKPEANPPIEDGLGHIGPWSPDMLVLAAEYVASNNIQAIYRLLGNCVSVHERPSNGSRSGETLLEIACKPQSSVSTFRMLLRFADCKRLNDVDDMSQGLIHYLTEYSPEQDLKLGALLDKGTDPNKGCGQYPPLVRCIFKGQYRAAMVLLDKGANPTHATTNGVDAIYAASSTGSVAILKRIRLIVPPDFHWGRKLPMQIPIGCTLYTTIALDGDAIHLAATHGFAAVIRFYYSLGVDVNHAMGDDLNQPIHSAASSGSVDCIQALHDCGADLTAQSADGLTALHMAVLGNHAPAARMLLKLAGGSLNKMRDNMGVTPFEYADGFGDRDTLRVFTDGQFFKLEPINA